MSASPNSVRPLPHLLRDALEEGGLPDVERWWRDLEVSHQAEVLQLWQDCGDLHFGPTRQGDQAMELRVTGTPQDPKSDHFEGFWNHEFYDYLVNHEAFYFEEVRYHVCTAQPAAQAAIRQGSISPEFVCDLASPDCPMRSRLADFAERTIRLSITFVPKGSPA